MLSAEVALEEGIAQAMDETLADNPELSDMYDVHPSGTHGAGAPQINPSTEDGDQQGSESGQHDPQQETMELDHDPTQTVPPHRKDKILGPPCNTSIGNLGHVSLSPTLKAEEFDSDEDVSICKLTPEETRIKERVWVTMNADWLRKNHAKRIKKELSDAEMRARGLDPEEEERKKKAAKGKRKDGTKKPGRRGDVSYLKQSNKKKKKLSAVENEEDNGEGGRGTDRR